MDSEPGSPMLMERFIEGQSLQLKTALRTHYLMVGARLVFIFAHGATLVTASYSLGWEIDLSWWLIFLPVWLGDVLCMILLIWGWFASWPYIKLCLHARQARVGDTNPSILTELIPEIVMAVVAFLFMLFIFAAEFSLCGYFDSSRREVPTNFIPCAVLFFLVSFCGFCRGACISTDGDVFALVGLGTFATFVAMLSVPGGLWSENGWSIASPALVGTFGLLISSLQRYRCYKHVLNGEEKALRLVELLLFFVLLAAITALCYTLHTIGARGCAATGSAADCSIIAKEGIATGAAVCFIALFRLPMAVIESRHIQVRDRLLVGNG